MSQSTQDHKLSTILTLLPPYLPDIQTLHSLLLTSRATRQTTLDVLTPHVLFSISENSRLFGNDDPEGLYLLSLISPGFAPWLHDSSSNRIAFKRACWGLPHSLLDLARRYPVIVNASGLSLGVLRRTQRRRAVVVLLNDLADRCVGEQWYATPDFWNDGAEDAATLESDPGKVVWQLAVYGGMFGEGVRSWVRGLVRVQAGKGDAKDTTDTTHTTDATNATDTMDTNEIRFATDESLGAENVYRPTGDNSDRILQETAIHKLRISETGARQTTGGLREDTSARLEGTAVNSTRHISDAMTTTQHTTDETPAPSPDSPYVSIALRCELVKYLIYDWHTCFWRRKDARPWGIDSDWEYPSSLISPDDDEEDSVRSAVDGDGDDGVSAGSDVMNEGQATALPLQTIPSWTPQAIQETSGEDAQIERLDGQLDDDHNDANEIDEDDDDNDEDGQSNGPNNANDATRRRRVVMVAPVGENPETDDEDETDNEDDDSIPPWIYAPTFHPLREVRMTGPYTPAKMEPRRPEHALVLLHLLRVSPLWAQLTSAIRRRAIDLSNRNKNQSGKTATEEFGTTRIAFGWEGTPPWKQVIWEDALWTSGWDGLELIADAWEWSEENHKAIARREAREASLGSAAIPGEQELDKRIVDDHPALLRLVGIYEELTLLHHEPETIEFRSIARPSRKMKGYEGPVLVTDMEMMTWDPM